MFPLLFVLAVLVTAAVLPVLCFHPSFRIPVGRLFAVFAAVFVLLQMPTLAYAQDTTVSLDGFFGWARPYVVELISLLIGAALLWLTKRVHDWTGINIEAKHREALQSALTNGANLALGRLPIDNKVDLKSAAVAAGMRYVLDSVPDAVAYFKLTPERVREMLEPKLAAPAVTATAKAA